MITQRKCSYLVETTDHQNLYKKTHSSFDFLAQPNLLNASVIKRHKVIVNFVNEQ